MVIPCPKCGNQIKATLTMCPECGAMVDLYSRSYELHLVAILGSSNAEQRVQVCMILGCRGKRSSTPVLIELLRDPENSVREAALRALGEIGDPKAAAAVEKLTTSENDYVRNTAKYVLRTLIGTGAAVQERQAS